jgi:sugar phosphate isomerase/epimerase
MKQQKKPAAASRTSRSRSPNRKAVVHGRIKQCIAPWCFQFFGEKWSLEKVCQVAAKLGCPSVELVHPSDFPLLKKYGLGCALTFINTDPDPPFLRGFNNPDNWQRLTRITKEAIDGAVTFRSPNVICFTGYAARNPGDPASPLISPEDGARNCVEGFKRVVSYAEKKKVTLCMEMLNSRVTDHPMKGHPGYQGDHIDYCVDILKRVGSPRLKLLFDVYHAQIMDGDIITRLRAHRDVIGHVHVAGNPGRGELDGPQEIHYPSVMQALLDIGYKGFVGQEFIPTRDPYQGLFEAVRLCDV